MRLTSFLQSPLWCILFCICIDHVWGQEGPCSQEIMQELRAFLEEKFSAIDNRLDRVEGSLRDVKTELALVRGEGQILQQESCSNCNEDVSQQFQELTTQVSSLEDNIIDAIDNTSLLLQKGKHSNTTIYRMYIQIIIK